MSHEMRERANASEPGERSGAQGPRERASRGAPGGEAPRMRRTSVPGETAVHLIKTATHGRVLVRRTHDTATGMLVGFHGYAESADVQLERLDAIPGASSWTQVSVQGLNRFYRSRTQDTIAGWMTRQDRERAIDDNVEYVNAAVDAVLAGRPEDRTANLPIVFVGFSQGVAMAFRAAVLGRVRGSGVIAVGGDVPPELFSIQDVRFPPALLVRGRQDDWYTQAKLDADVAALQERGVDVRTAVLDIRHEWTPEVSVEAGHFLFRFCS
jgi:predicted esterase